ncbi:hypothetical protein [Radicibacter daui]
MASSGNRSVDFDQMTRDRLAGWHSFTNISKVVVGLIIVALLGMWAFLV